MKSIVFLDFIKFNKKILFVGGLWNSKYFSQHIYRQLSRFRHLTFVSCREVTQDDIDKNQVIICYSIAIQYVHKLNLQGKKVILLSPLLNNDFIRGEMIYIANTALEKLLKNQEINPMVNFIFNACGGDEESNKVWWNDMRLWLKQYSNIENVVDITPDDSWIIIEGRMPISNLPRIDIKTPYGHMIPVQDDYHFLDKAI